MYIWYVNGKCYIYIYIQQYVLTSFDTIICVGPIDTCWEGAVLQLQLCFPIEYPQRPPTVRFTSAIYHPNVFSDGNLCLDLLQDNWSPIYSVSTILKSIQSLLTDPNVNSPANPDAAKLYTTNKKEYNKKVRSVVSKGK